jgi:hypothetical protein
VVSGPMLNQAVSRAESIRKLSRALLRNHRRVLS